MPSWYLETVHVTIYTIESDQEYAPTFKWHTNTLPIMHRYTCRDGVSVFHTVEAQYRSSRRG